MSLRRPASDGFGRGLPLEPTSSATPMIPLRTAAAGLLLLAAIPSSAVAQASGRRPMTITDLITAIRVGDPRVSPDGRRVLFVRTTTDSVTGKRNADIWAVASDGSGQPRPLIAGPGSDDNPRFLADGRIAFISARSGTPQVYLADAAGGHVRAVSRISGGVQPPLVVSPDGRRVAYVSDAYPQCQDDSCNAKVRDSVAHDPVKLHRLTRLPYRHWSDWWEQVRHHVFVTELDRRRDARPHAGRLRQSAAQLRGCGARVLAGRARSRLRLQAGRRRTRRCGPPTTTSGRCR